MKQLSSVAVCALCLALGAGPVSAQDSASITQSGAGNNATIDQLASNGDNYVTVRQGENWYGNSGDNNSAQVLQQGVQSSDVWISQPGSYNQYTVSQYNGANLQVTINMESSYYGDMGEGNMVMVEQSGYDSRAVIEQGGSRYSRAEIVQSGWEGGSLADIRQSGEGNQATLFQSGSNQGLIHQSGNNLNASIIQNTNGTSYGYGYGFGYGYGGNMATIRQGH